MAKTIDLQSLIDQDQMAVQISNYYREWEQRRMTWVETTDEVRQYIFATSTGGTQNELAPWKNTVHIPKLCQIRDNLHANYMAALFPRANSIVWEGDNIEAETIEKRRAIESYMTNKLRASGFRTEVAKLVHDFIDYGNAFAMPVFVAESHTDPSTGEVIPGYIGPRLERISPLDIVFDPTAASFAEAPKIIRSVRTVGSMASDIASKPELSYLQEALDKSLKARHMFSGMSKGDQSKISAYNMDGFGSFFDYMQSNYVEVLDFYGDVYNPETGQLEVNKLISVIDRSYIVRNITNPSWFGKTQIYHVGWRLRPDNLYAMGPLDNLVGMQHRIDHLENAKADAYDLFIHPVMKVRGFVDEFDYGPSERIYVGEEGDVEFMSPDVNFLNADTQIAMYEAKMEEMAGAPKQAMGFRTPGEKTAYEVQALENGANRIFYNKTTYFEEVFLEPILGSMLELARRNLDRNDVIRVLDEKTGAVIFQNITKQDITARGKIRPMGARHFAQNTQMVQNLTAMYGSPIGMDESVKVHISGKNLAKAMQELLGIEKYEFFGENIRVLEQSETQRLVNAVQQISAEEQGGTLPGEPPLQPGQTPNNIGVAQ